MVFGFFGSYEGNLNSVKAMCRPTPAAVCGESPVDRFFNISASSTNEREAHDRAGERALVGP